MEITSTPAAPTFTVTIDPTNARSIIADYATEAEATDRFNREVAKLADRGGSVYITWGVTTIKSYRSQPLPTL